MVTVEVFCDHPDNANTYLIKKGGHGLIIDPANNLKTLNKFVEGLIIDGVLLTHGHYDHFKSLKEVLDTYDTFCYLHKDAKKKLYDLHSSYALAFGETTMPNIPINKLSIIEKEQKIKVGIFEIKVLFTPGHTNCSVIYIIEDKMFSGDTLFKNSVGRTDLLTGNAVVLKLSLEKIKKIKTNYQIYPGHDEDTYLDIEIKYNPYLIKY